MKTTKPITAEESANIVDRYRRGQGLDYIALGTDRSRAVIRQVLTEAGVPIRKRGASNPNWGRTGGFA
jgi:hypothetical protein